MSSTSLKLLSKTDNYTKYIVYGWIRAAEKDLRMGHVPMAIDVICILYYRDDDIFDVRACENVTVSENKKSIICISSLGHNNICCNYGITQILSKDDIICRWDLKINKKSRGGIRIGVSTMRQLGRFWDVIENNDCYLYSSIGTRFAVQKGRRRWRNYGNCKKYGQNDTVSIILDLRKRTINYLVNEQNQGIAYRNIKKDDETKYQLIVALESKDDCIEIVDFSKC